MEETDVGTAEAQAPEDDEGLDKCEGVSYLLMSAFPDSSAIVKMPASVSCEQE
jgi:hypothetical protein